MFKKIVRKVGEKLFGFELPVIDGDPDEWCHPERTAGGRIASADDALIIVMNPHVGFSPERGQVLIMGTMIAELHEGTRFDCIVADDAVVALPLDCPAAADAAMLTGVVCASVTMFVVDGEVVAAPEWVPA